MSENVGQWILLRRVLGLLWDNDRNVSAKKKQLPQSFLKCIAYLVVM